MWTGRDGCWITLAELEARRREWHELARESEFPSAFSDPAWILAWWRHYGEGHEPWSFAVRDRDGSLRALALLARRRLRPVRTLGFAGGRWNGTESLICRPGDERVLVASLLRALRNRRAEWDLWRIRRLPTASLLARELLAGGAALRSAAHDLPLQPYLELPASRETLEGHLHGKRRTELRRKWRRLLELGAQPRLVTDPAEVGGVITMMLDLHRRRAREKGERHSQMDARFVRFVTDVVRDLLPEGARLWTLELGGKALTTRLSLVQGPREEGFLVGMRDDHATLSPGRGLERHALLASIAEGRNELDYGAGREPYKYCWGAIDRELARIVVASPTGRGRLTGACAAADLRLRDSAAADVLRRLKGLTAERASADAPRVAHEPAHGPQPAHAPQPAPPQPQGVQAKGRAGDAPGRLQRNRESPKGASGRGRQPARKH